jgi:hypothetical protein
MERTGATASAHARVEILMRPPSMMTVMVMMRKKMK